jgi:hypothetical protein
MSELWQSLSIGDKVRVVKWPTELIRDRMHRETSELYDWLIENRCMLTIVEKDFWRLPYWKICRSEGGIEFTEYLALNHDGIEVVVE